MDTRVSTNQLFRQQFTLTNAKYKYVEFSYSRKEEMRCIMTH